MKKSPNDKVPGPIGIFDSGFGGLTILRKIVEKLPQHDFVYLGDNARAPYGSRSFETVYQYTLECVQKLFGMGCHLVLLACNTASAKALRAIQQNDLPRMDPDRRVLGVIRPTTELIGNYTKSGHIGILGTAGTVSSGSYLIEVERFYPDLKVYQEACPMWVPLIENNEIENEGADYFIRRHISSLMRKSGKIDAVILGCTHYPLIQHKIRLHLPAHVNIVSQGPIVADGLYDYLQRHPEMDARCSRNGRREFLTTDEPSSFDAAASLFYCGSVRSEHIDPN